MNCNIEELKSKKEKQLNTKTVFRCFECLIHRHFKSIFNLNIKHIYALKRTYNYSVSLESA